MKPLKGNTGKELLNSLKTGIPIVKLASIDPVLWEYLLYTLLSIVNDLGLPMLMPVGFRTRELSAKDWDEHGLKAARSVLSKFNLVPAIVELLKAGQDAAAGEPESSKGKLAWESDLKSVPVDGFQVSVKPLDEKM